MKSLRGHFLIASPHLADPNFYKSVVLIIKHDDDGAFGLILNRPTGDAVRDDLSQLVGEEHDINGGAVVYMGGPVSGPLVVLHRCKAAAEMEIFRGLYFSANKHKLRKVASQTARPYRFFRGYAGWAEGQLEGELQAGGWLTAKAKKEMIFDDSEALWDLAVRSIGEGILGKAAKIKHVPENPSLN